MAYTGTGTQADPYVVTTGLSLIECIRKGSGLYIKVANDIDFANEDDYTGKISGTLDLSASHLYADTPKNIYGLTVEGESFFHGGDVFNGNAYLENVNFLNCVFKQTTITGRNGGIFDGNNGNWAMYTNNCKFSFVAAMSTYTYPIFSYVICTDSSFYINIASANPLQPFKEYDFTGDHQPINRFTRCNIVIDGAKYKTPANGATPGLVQTTASSSYGTTIKLDTSSLIFKDCDITAVPASGELFILYVQGTVPSFLDNSYVAFLNCTVNGQSTNSGTPFTLTGHTVSYPPTGTLAITAADNMTVGTGSTVKPITISNLKDKNYLIDIGFLP